MPKSKKPATVKELSKKKVVKKPAKKVISGVDAIPSPSPEKIKPNPGLSSFRE